MCGALLLTITKMYWSLFDVVFDGIVWELQLLQSLLIGDQFNGQIYRTNSIVKFVF